MSCSIICSLLLLVPAQGNAKAYPRPELLIEASELAKPEVAKKFRILDTRPLNEFKQERIPSSMNVNVSVWSKRFAAGPDAKEWEKLLGEFAIDINVPVVVQGNDMRETARIWWILRYWGVKDARILNGGWSAWVAGKYPVERGEAATKSAVQTTSPKLIPAEQHLATKEQIKDSLKDKLFQIVDARSEGEYCGEVKTAKRAGAIPGAVNLEWKSVLDAKTQKIKSPVELEQVFKQAGIDLAKPAVAHCQSGGRSSVIVFAMELMGATEIRNYYRSWAEWGNADDTPVEQVQRKK
jgi:thiosulfate/3-mercaptopyruvate sulfurtransferase